MLANGGGVRGSESERGGDEREAEREIVSYLWAP
jgi:hypothetical protein